MRDIIRHDLAGIHYTRRFDTVGNDIEVEGGVDSIHQTNTLQRHNQGHDIIIEEVGVGASAKSIHIRKCIASSLLNG